MHEGPTKRPKTAKGRLHKPGEPSERRGAARSPFNGDFDIEIPHTGGLESDTHVEGRDFDAMCKSRDRRDIRPLLL
ncbi:MAG TPA: hypothetical protein VF511_01840, partial [Chthoniobacterales bacterium]